MYAIHKNTTKTNKVGKKLNKKYATQILVSEDVWNLYDKKRGEFIDEVDIRGREEKVKIYKLF